jgi:hypothetical protein
MHRARHRVPAHSFCRRHRAPIFFRRRMTFGRKFSSLRRARRRVMRCPVSSSSQRPFSCYPKISLRLPSIPTPSFQKIFLRQLFSKWISSWPISLRLSCHHHQRRRSIRDLPFVRRRLRRRVTRHHPKPHRRLPPCRNHP